MSLAGLERPEVSPDQVLAELERIFASDDFSRSERCQRFLQYVCDLTLRGEASRINQYLIGSEVFGRGAEYSTQEDSVVRRQAHVLRQKLNAYYAREGRDDPIRIELPVGQYVPLFRQQSSRVVAEAVPVPIARKWARLPLAMLAAAALLFIGWGIGRRSAVLEARSRPPAAVRQIWGSWLDNPAGLAICLSNPMTAMVKYQLEPVAPGLASGRFSADEDLEEALRETFSLPQGGYFYLLPSRVNTKVGESLAAALLTAFFTKVAVPVRVTESRLVSWEDLRMQNFIILGHSEANPWIDPLLHKYPFRLGETKGQRLRYIINTSPAADETSEYAVEYPEGKNKPTLEYALISMIPGLDVNRNLLVISGLNTQATQMAAELLTEPGRLGELHSRLKSAAPLHEGPWYFQAVVRVEVRDKTPTAGPEIVAIRVL